MPKRIIAHIRRESFLVNFLWFLLITAFIARIVTWNNVELRGIYGVNIMVYLGFIILIKVERILKIMGALQDQDTREQDTRADIRAVERGNDHADAVAAANTEAVTAQAEANAAAVRNSRLDPGP